MKVFMESWKLLLIEGGVFESEANISKAEVGKLQIEPVLLRIALP